MIATADFCRPLLSQFPILLIDTRGVPDIPFSGRKWSGFGGQRNGFFFFFTAQKYGLSLPFILIHSCLSFLSYLLNHSYLTLRRQIPETGKGGVRARSRVPRHLGGSGSHRPGNASRLVVRLEPLGGLLKWDLQKALLLIYSFNGHISCSPFSAYKMSSVQTTRGVTDVNFQVFGSMRTEPFLGSQEDCK